MKITQSEESANKTEQSISLNFDKQSPFQKQVVAQFFSRHWLTLSGLSLLIIALLFVVFWLPSSVDKPALKLDPKTVMAQEPVKALDESPWQEAQLAKYRRSAQEVLSKVLEQQKNLENKHVEFWAEEDFEQALKDAEAGDYLYRNQEFDEAIASYNLALSQLDAILAQVPVKFEHFYKLGKIAIAENQALKAKKMLQIALYIKPSDENGEAAFDRAIVLDRVLVLVKAGVILMDEQQFEQAKNKFTQAYELDNHSPLIDEQLALVNKTITDRNYSSAMSKGYNSLNKKDFELAIKYFTQAGKILPKENDPKQAIEQSKNKHVEQKIATHIFKAKAKEVKEEWQGANEGYNAALALDKSLMNARLGVLRTSARNTLDKNILHIINNPERLTNNNVFQQAVNTHNNATKIKQPGPKLVQQIMSIKQLLAQMKIPVALRIESDNQTKISIHRVGDLGQFLAKNISLKPGDYTVVGSRDGFRDVRQSFTLTPTNQTKTIIVSCNEKVTNG